METKVGDVALVFVKYILWAVLTAMLVFILLTGRTSLIAVIARYADTGFYQAKQVRVIDQVYLAIAGILALASIVVLQHYMTNASGWKNTLRRFAFSLGILLIVLALFILVAQISHGDIFTSAPSVIALFGPLLAGTSFIVVGAIYKTF